MVCDSITITIGCTLGVRLTDESGLPMFPGGGKTTQFLKNGPGALSLEVQHTQFPELGELDLLFDSGASWKVFRKDELHVFVMQAPQASQPFLIATVDFHAGRGHIYMSDLIDPPLYPFDYPLDEVIFSKLLADRSSVIVHACGVSYNGGGILFPGHSGAGKSTFASLLSHYPEATVLSDDRIVVSVRDDGVYLSGTPWLGSAGFASPESAPLRQILFLQHDAVNRVESMSVIDATTQLLGLSVLPYWDAGSVEKAIETTARVIERIPAARFGFVPDVSAAEFLLHEIDFAQR